MSMDEIELDKFINEFQTNTIKNLCCMALNQNTLQLPSHVPGRFFYFSIHIGIGSCCTNFLKFLETQPKHCL
ncbi:hypothetical protein GYH30_014374 [Glycine max]|uniref:Uncharacterized protein n=1 Tax=Glycine max TaxID=3847 RepID=A0A0R0JDI8_SOYBN|nr:hypothetical protein GYH30_014374 [Glycine max]